MPKKEVKEIPPIPVDETSLEEVVRIIKTGLVHHPVVSRTTRTTLTQWYREREDEINAAEHPEVEDE